MRRAFGWLLVLVILAGGGWYGWRWWQERHGAQDPSAARDQMQAQGPQGGTNPQGPGARREGGGAGGGNRPRRAGGPGGGTAVPVTVAEAARRDVALTVDALGTVVPLQSVVVRTQLDGQLMEVNFREGQEVAEGDVLARVDDRTVRAALQQAEGKKAYDQAQLANARVDLTRYQGLVRASGATQQQVDTQRAQVAMLEAQVQQDDAAIAQSRTQLGFATIRSPLAGRVGIRQVDAGNLVRSSDTAGIVSVTQMAPISVTFTLPQQELPRLTRALASGAVPVETLPGPSSSSGGTQPVARGTLLTIDNSVDATTGTIKAKAVFPNEDRALWPGAFVNLRLRIEVVPQAVVVPLVSIQRGPEGSYAFVVKEDRTVEQRPVTLGQTTMADAVVQSGIQPGERVVTSGGLRLSAGTTVALQDENAPTRQPGSRPRRTAEARETAN
ncbi:efflux RND transporter periplasmic adaptor subunit [Pararoseomonas indoligenes]|uniref:Efflux RND transporter periplasmic adaptor subunit n=1 Tax=Roseomonas indoligenes TaxID=2820811 RepID=A0A940MQT4_9PROT|nr:efflux RND transporter periplasmic adaptor subunit [Pararoseomonas indoligenes]MBP0492318.1 efflux RND transporter periplasmic adaptor subunit [Pararoseomonas indoligenes]